MSTPKRVFISADNGLAVIYFLQSDVVPTLTAGGAEVVILTDDGLKPQMLERFGGPKVHVEGLRLEEARRPTRAPKPLARSSWRRWLPASQ